MKTKIRKFIRIIAREKSAYATVLRIYSAVAALFVLAAILGGGLIALLRVIEALSFIALLLILRAEERSSRYLMYLRATWHGYDMARCQLKEFVKNNRKGGVCGMVVVELNRVLEWNENNESEFSFSLDFLPISMKYEIHGFGDKERLFLSIEAGDTVHCHKVDQYRTIEEAKIEAQEHYNKMIKDFLEQIEHKFD